MSRRRLRFAVTVVTVAGLVLGATVAEAIAGPGGSPDPLTLWQAYRAGWLAIPVTLGVYVGGRALLDHRRWFARRWPRAVAFLDRGKVWAVLAGAVSFAGMLLPLAIQGDLTGAAFNAQLAMAVGVYVHSTRPVAS